MHLQVKSFGFQASLVVTINYWRVILPWFMPEDHT